MSGFCYLLTTELKIVYLVSINYYIIIVTTNTELDPKTGLESGNLIPTNSMLIHVLTYIYISKFKVMSTYKVVIYHLMTFIITIRYVKLQIFYIKTTIL